MRYTELPLELPRTLWVFIRFWDRVLGYAMECIPITCYTGNLEIIFTGNKSIVFFSGMSKLFSSNTGVL